MARIATLSCRLSRGLSLLARNASFTLASWRFSHCEQRDADQSPARLIAHDGSAKWAFGDARHGRVNAVLEAEDRQGDAEI